MRRWLAAAALCLFLVACTPEAYYTTNLINADRAQYGLAPLEFNVMLHLKAQAWSAQLARQGYLSHSTLTDDNWSTTWTKLGENVAHAWTLNDAEVFLMNSPSHRANILDRTYNKVGTGVTSTGDGTFWVVQEFMHEYCC